MQGPNDCTIGDCTIKTFVGVTTHTALVLKGVLSSVEGMCTFKMSVQAMALNAACFKIFSGVKRVQPVLVLTVGPYGANRSNTVTVVAGCATEGFGVVDSKQVTSWVTCK